jgi:hypothetical protein
MPTPNHHETLGTRLLAELARRRAIGALFNFSQRRQLRQIDDRQELRSCLAKWRLGQIDTSGSEKQIIDALWSANEPGRSATIIECGLGLLSIAAELLRLVIWHFR